MTEQERVEAALKEYETFRERIMAEYGCIIDVELDSRTEKHGKQVQVVPVGDVVIGAVKDWQPALADES